MPWTWTARASGIPAGGTYPPVGLATHYHTDWVRPYWSDSLEKIAIVDTHLFFRWPGYWGTPGAFRGNVAGVEAPVAKMAALFERRQAREPGIHPNAVIDPTARIAPGAALVTLHQVHSATVIPVTAAYPDDARPHADAMVKELIALIDLNRDAARAASGTSNEVFANATALVQTLSAVPGLEDVKATAAATRQLNGTERFTIDFVLKPPPPPAAPEAAPAQAAEAPSAAASDQAVKP